MSWHLGRIFCLATVLTFHPDSQGATDGVSRTEDVPKVKVLLFDFVSLPEKTQKVVQDRVASIFRKAGVEMEWAPCSTTEGQLALFPDCTGYKAPTTVLLRMRPPLAKKAKADAAGESLYSARIVNIFWDHARKESAGLNVPIADMLAAIIAHEMGHIFLGPNSHSLSGIMAAKWKPRDLIAISQGGYGFSPQQRDLIQAEVKRRQAQQSASGLPPVR